MRQDLLKNLVILDEGQLRNAPKEQLVTIFNQLDSTKKNLDAEIVTLRVTLDSKKEEKGRILSDIKEEFKVSTVEELETLREDKIKKLASLGEALRVKSGGF